MEQAIDLMEMLGDAEIKYAINGLLSLTPDAMPVLGETPEVRNLWSAAAVWVKEGPGIAQLVAEWMVHGYPRMCDPHGSDIARFYEHEKTEHHIYARCGEHFNKTYGIVHPREQWATQRGMRRSPFFAREEALGAVFYDARGWERPQWYESNADLMERYPGKCEPREHEWDARWWSPIINAEHLHLREHVGMVDLTAFNEFDFEGPGALAFLDHMTVNSCNVAGRALGVHAVAHRRRRLPLRPHDHAPRRAPLPGRHRRLRRRPRQVLVHAQHADRRFGARSPTSTSGICTIGVWGPKAQATMAKIVTGQQQAVRRHAGRLPVRIGARRADRRRAVHDVPHLLRRRERLGDLHQDGARAAPVGHDLGGRAGVRHPPGRDRGLRRHRPDREGLPPDGGRARERVQPGRGRAGAPEGEVGRLHRQGGLPQGARRSRRASGPAAIMCTLSIDDQTSAAGIKRYPTGGNEPIVTLDGERIVDAHGRPSRVTTAGAAPSLGTYLLLAYLPPEHAVEGNKLGVVYMNEQYPVTVARVGSQPLFDPDDSA